MMLTDLGVEVTPKAPELRKGANSSHRNAGHSDDDVLSTYRNTSCQGANSDDLARKVAVEALTEVILEQRQASGSIGTQIDRNSGPPSPTEYFASIVAAIQGTSSSHLATLVFLLSIVLMSVPKAVLRDQGDECLHRLLSIIKSVSDDANEGDDDSDANNAQKTIRYCVVCLGIALAAQDGGKVTWNRPKNIQALLLMLNCASDPRPKLRKVSQNALVMILEQQKEGCLEPFRTICKVSVTKIARSTLVNVKESMHLLNFIAAAMPSLVKFSSPLDCAGLAVEIVGTLKLGHSRLSRVAFQTLQAYFDGLKTLLSERKVTELKSCIESLEKVENVLIQLIYRDKERKSITLDSEVCAVWVLALRTAEFLLYDASSREGDIRSGLPKVSDALLRCAGDGIDIATNGKTDPCGQAQVVLPLGTLTQIVLHHQKLIRKPQLVVGLMSSLNQLWSPHFEETWPVAVDVIEAVFVSNGSCERIVTDATTPVTEQENQWIQQLATVRERIIDPISGNDKNDIVARWRGAVEGAIGAAISMLGVERVLGILPLRGDKLGGKGIHPLRAWLLPILREKIGHVPVHQTKPGATITGSDSGPQAATTSLEYFRTQVLTIALECESLALNGNHGQHSVRILRSRALQIWSLFPSFCAKPNDICSKSGFPALVAVLEKELDMDEAEGIDKLALVCVGLKELIQGVIEDKTDVKKHELEKKTISSFAGTFLPRLFQLYDGLVFSNKMDHVETVHSLIEAYSTIAPRELVNKLFLQVLRRIVAELSETGATSTVSQSANKNQITRDGDDDSDASVESDESDSEEAPIDESVNSEERKRLYILVGISLALIPVLDSQSTTMLYRVSKPFIEDADERLLQKRGYRILEAICQHQHAWVFDNRNDLLTLIRGSFFSSSASSKTARLNCLEHIVTLLSASESKLPADDLMNLVQDLVGEVVLCTKEVSTKARAAGYKLLIVLAKCLQSVAEKANPDAKMDGLRKFLHMVLACLSSNTSHMRSAGVNALCRLYSEFGKFPEIQDDFVEVAEAVLVLLNEKCREVAKSVIGFAKVCVVRLPVSSVTLLLKSILSGLLPWADTTQNRFRMKIRVVFERLLKRVGEDPIHACGVIPQDHKLLTYIRRQSAYKKRLNLRNSGLDGTDNRKQKQDTRKRRNSDGSDIESDDDIVLDEGDGDALDFLDVSNVNRVRKKNINSRKDSGLDDFKISEDGRIVVPFDEDGTDKPELDVALDESDDESVDMSQKRRRRRYSSDDEMEEDKRPNTKRPSKDPKVGESGQKGSEFKAKRANGDVKVKGSKLEPFAYIPLDHKLLNKRRKHESARAWKGVNFKSSKKKADRGLSGRNMTAKLSGKRNVKN